MVDCEHPWKMPQRLYSRRKADSLWHLGAEQRLLQFDFKIKNKWKFNYFIGDQRTAVVKWNINKHGESEPGLLNEVHLQAQHSWCRPMCRKQQAWQRRMACCRLQRKPKLVREFFKDFFLLIIEETEGKKAPGGTRSFSDCYRLTSDQMTGF